MSFMRAIRQFVALLAISGLFVSTALSAGSIKFVSTADFALTPQGFALAFQPWMNKSRYSLPRLFVYNSAGKLVAAVGGYSKELPEVLDKIFAKKTTDDRYPTLVALLEQSKDAATGAAKRKEFATSQFVLIEFSAEWCAPCHLLRRDVLAYQTAHPELKFAYAVFDADMSGRPPEEQTAIRKAMGVKSLPKQP